LWVILRSHFCFSGSCKERVELSESLFCVYWNSSVCCVIFFPFVTHSTFCPEPRGNNDQFELVLQGFYNSVNPERAPDRNKKVGAEKKRELKHRGASRSTRRNPGGAAFLAVCRGKVFKIIFCCYGS